MRRAAVEKGVETNARARMTDEAGNSFRRAEKLWSLSQNLILSDYLKTREGKDPY